MLRNRPGMTLVEVLIALSLTAIVGAMITSVFVSQSRFFDHQEKVGAARAVSRGAMNVMMSDLRMLERGGGIAAATNQSITIRAPYALALYCGISGGVMRVSRMPVDPSVLADNGFSGYAYRTGDGSYVYVNGGGVPTNGTTADCTGAGIAVLPAAEGGVVQNVPAGVALNPGRAIFFYQTLTYSFKNSVSVPGQKALWRRIHATNVEEELVAPFAPTARFRFYVNDAVTAQSSVPGTLSTITGIEIVLDGLSERPNSDGTFQSAPLATSVFFKNR